MDGVYYICISLQHTIAHHVQECKHASPTRVVQYAFTHGVLAHWLAESNVCSMDTDVSWRLACGRDDEDLGAKDQPTSSVAWKQGGNQLTVTTNSSRLPSHSRLRLNRFAATNLWCRIWRGGRAGVGVD